VEDTGPGIPTELRDRVFDLFYTTRTEGTGVGLAMVRQSVELHGGRVELDSTPGQGATFTLVLPVQDNS
jgi:signal transduction histidine kinase